MDTTKITEKMVSLSEENKALKDLLPDKEVQKAIEENKSEIQGLQWDLYYDQILENIQENHTDFHNTVYRPWLEENLGTQQIDYSPEMVDYFMDKLHIDGVKILTKKEAELMMTKQKADGLKVAKKMSASDFMADYPDNTMKCGGSVERKGVGGFLAGLVLGSYGGYKVGLLQDKRDPKDLMREEKNYLRKRREKQARKNREKDIIDVEYTEVKRKGGKIGNISIASLKRGTQYDMPIKKGLENRAIRYNKDKKRYELWNYQTKEVDYSYSELDDLLRNTNRIFNIEDVSYAKGGETEGPFFDPQPEVSKRLNKKWNWYYQSAGAQSVMIDDMPDEAKKTIHNRFLKEIREEMKKEGYPIEDYKENLSKADTDVLWEKHKKRYAKGGVLDIGDYVKIDGGGETKIIKNFDDEWKFIDYQEGKPNSGVMLWVGKEDTEGHIPDKYNSEFNQLIKEQPDGGYYVEEQGRKFEEDEWEDWFDLKYGDEYRNYEGLGGYVSPDRLTKTEDYAKGGLTADKARQILEDGEANERPLTDKQKRYFKWVASNKKSKYAKGGMIPYDEYADSLSDYGELDGKRVYNQHTERYGYINEDEIRNEGKKSGMGFMVWVSPDRDTDRGSNWDIDDTFIIEEEDYAKGGKTKHKDEYEIDYKVYDKDGEELIDERGYVSVEADNKKKARNKAQIKIDKNLNDGEYAELDIQTIYDGKTGYIIYHEDRTYDVELKKEWDDYGEMTGGYYNTNEYAKGGKTSLTRRYVYDELDDILSKSSHFQINEEENHGLPGLFIQKDYEGKEIKNLQSDRKKLIKYFTDEGLNKSAIQVWTQKDEDASYLLARITPDEMLEEGAEEREQNYLDRTGYAKGGEIEKHYKIEFLDENEEIIDVERYGDTEPDQDDYYEMAGKLNAYSGIVYSYDEDDEDDTLKDEGFYETDFGVFQYKKGGRLNTPGYISADEMSNLQKEMRGGRNEDVYDELAKDIEGKVYTAFSDDRSVLAQSTKKVWKDDDTPVLKYIARAPKKKVKLPGKFRVVEDPKYGWWYFLDKGVWYGINKDDYESTPPFEYGKGGKTEVLEPTPTYELPKAITQTLKGLPIMMNKGGEMTDKTDVYFDDNEFGGYTVVIDDAVFEMNDQSSVNMDVNSYIGERNEYPSDISHWGKKLTNDEIPFIIKEKINKRKLEWNEYKSGGELKVKPGYVRKRKEFTTMLQTGPNYKPYIDITEDEEERLSEKYKGEWYFTEFDTIKYFDNEKQEWDYDSYFEKGGSVSDHFEVVDVMAGDTYDSVLEKQDIIDWAGQLSKGKPSKLNFNQAKKIMRDNHLIVQDFGKGGKVDTDATVAALKELKKDFNSQDDEYEEITKAIKELNQEICADDIAYASSGGGGNPWATSETTERWTIFRSNTGKEKKFRKWIDDDGRYKTSGEAPIETRITDITAVGFSQSVDLEGEKFTTLSSNHKAGNTMIKNIPSEKCQRGTFYWLVKSKTTVWHN